MIIVDNLDWAQTIKQIGLGCFRKISGKRILPLEYFDTTPSASRLLRFFERLGCCQSRKMDYSLIEVTDKEGHSVWGLCENVDTLDLSRRIYEEKFLKSPVTAYLGAYMKPQRLAIYIKKCIAQDLERRLQRIQVVGWQYRRRKLSGGGPIYVLESSPWDLWLRRYADERGVSLKFVKRVNLIPASAGFLFRQTLDVISRRFRKRDSRKEPVGINHAQGPSAAPFKNMVAVSYQGLGVSLDSSRNTDLFWLRHSKINFPNLFIYFSSTHKPLDDEKLNLLNQANIRCVALDGRSSRSGRAIIWKGLGLKACFKDVFKALVGVLGVMRTDIEDWRFHCWLAQKAPFLVYRVLYWKTFFRDFDARVNVNYFAHGYDRLTMDQAMEDLRGISASFQRSDLYVPSVFLARSTDVNFNFSTAQIQKEIECGSDVAHLVPTGYLLDGSFNLVRGRSASLRERLRSKGAKFIICFFDENSLDDPRLGPSHEYRAVNYDFLIKKIFEDPGLGVIFKPKKPSTLRRRLGPVTPLLEDALASGRCHLVEGGDATTAMLPCEAALASDMSIGLLNGSTAVIEAVLAGSRGLLLDREGFKFHPLSRAENITFDGWDKLWEALESFREGARPSLGDWGSRVEDLDPFRDGKAAERMASYIGWLHEGLSGGLSNEACLRAASERYAAIWGGDKIRGNAAVCA